ncbi:diguanylate cyclase domain-containing protein [Isoptericola cucumis]|uniref:GGDEF domain-containing protein n=2 Tax=Isoptericola cucumis TaxID=1776856 RepID=A0ABQ2B8S0_9MICO|nr:GGDEF domain-containing protein [Isoptericola cucumis]GGI10457.1 hypothetical protein GCM10007368_31330 [Isoptericola cucumis]
MYDEIASMARHIAPRGGTGLAGVVGDLAQPVMVVGSAVPVGQLEVMFRRPDVACVAVQDDAGSDAVGLVTRAGLAAALTGRLGYGRAVLERRPAASVTDWSPLVVDPGTPVSQVATQAMARAGARRYDDVLVRGPFWGSATTADVMRSLVSALADRSTHDPHTRLPTRAATWQSLAHRCDLVRGGRTRVVLVLLDVRGMTALNSAHGHDAGDVVLAELAGRLTAALPRGCEAGRVDGDRFAVLATLPALDDVDAAASADALRQHVVSHLAEPSGQVAPAVWPALHSAVVWSVAGAADADELVSGAERRLRRAGAPLAAAS